MKKSFIYLLFCAVLFAPADLFSQSEYSTPKEVGERLQSIVRKNPKLAKLESLTKTPSSNDLWVVTLGSGDVALHPATAIVAGVDARHMVGTEAAIQLVESVLSRDDAAEFLAKYTIYVFPSVNPDATEGYFGALKCETNRTRSLYDNDRDGVMSEDAPEDLDGNSMITSMIVETTGGEWIKHPVQSNILIKADPKKGEVGKYALYTEGVDNDKDGLLNEDGQDGVDLNRNFTYKYKNWGSESGHYAVSEVENRALLDFMYDAFNIHTVISFGENDNIYSPTKFIHKGRKGGEPDKSTPQFGPAPAYNIAQMLDADNQLASKVSGIYKANDATANNILAVEPLDGNFTEWAYYHFGRNSFETNVWSIDQADDYGSREAAFVAWAQKNGVDDTTVDWSAVEHPDFKNKTVEVGSLKPYALYTPKLELVESQIDATIESVMDIVALSPEITLEVECEEVSKGIHRVTATVANVGEISTATAYGVQTYMVKYVRVELKPNGQSVLQGHKLRTIPYLGAGDVTTMSWIVEGKGKFEVEAGSPQSGYAVEVVTL